MFCSDNRSGRSAWDWPISSTHTVVGAVSALGMRGGGAVNLGVIKQIVISCLSRFRRVQDVSHLVPSFLKCSDPKKNFVIIHTLWLKCG
jgi:hypothetical protein